jgi:hypothetical protein
MVNNNISYNNIYYHLRSHSSTVRLRPTGRIHRQGVAGEAGVAGGRRHHWHRVARGEGGAAHIGARGGTWGGQGVGSLVIRSFRGVYMVFIWYLYGIYMVFRWYLDGISMV